MAGPKPPVAPPAPAAGDVPAVVSIGDLSPEGFESVPRLLVALESSLAEPAWPTGVDTGAAVTGVAAVVVV